MKQAVCNLTHGPAVGAARALPFFERDELDCVCGEPL